MFSLIYITKSNTTLSLLDTLSFTFTFSFLSFSFFVFLSKKTRQNSILKTRFFKNNFVLFCPDKTMTKSKISFLHSFIKPFMFGSSAGNNDEDLDRISAHDQQLFSFKTLVAATKNFHPTHKLGEGGFGPVYKGKLDDGREIAVKKLSHSSRQGKREFTNEAKLLSQVQHRNVVNLLGYCVHDAEKLLVYEYVPHESLDKLLFKNNRREELDWTKRFDIINGVARGLLYLHEDAHNCIIHRDIKASNILLDNKWAPKIADFGMARLYAEDVTHVHTRVAGTNGYMAPEYVMLGQLSIKVDVYSFGVVILELISGQRNSSFTVTSGAQSLLDWAYKLYKDGRTMEIIDPILASSAVPEQVALCVQIGLLCTQGDPHLRPTMRRLIVMLSKKASSLEEPTRPGVPGCRERRSHKSTTPSSSAGISVGSPHRTFGSTYDSTSGTANASRTRLDPHGKRPIES